MNLELAKTHFTMEEYNKNRKYKIEEKMRREEEEKMRRGGFAPNSCHYFLTTYQT